jgi:flagellar basal body-associated protein FliL
MNSEEKEQTDQDKHNMTRRQAVKTLIGAAAVVAAIPAIGSIALSSSGSQQREDQAALGSEAFNSTSEPLVILVGKDELRGFLGEKEYTVKDSSITHRILRAFSDARTD